MRDALLLAVIFGGLLATLRYPFAGMILWAWFCRFLVMMTAAQGLGSAIGPALRHL